MVWAVTTSLESLPEEEMFGFHAGVAPFLVMEQLLTSFTVQVIVGLPPLVTREGFAEMLELGACTVTVTERVAGVVPFAPVQVSWYGCEPGVLSGPVEPLLDTEGPLPLPMGPLPLYEVILEHDQFSIVEPPMLRSCVTAVSEPVG